MKFTEVLEEAWYTLTVKQRVATTLICFLLIVVFVWGLICRFG